MNSYSVTTEAISAKCRVLKFSAHLNSMVFTWSCADPSEVPYDGWIEFIERDRGYLAFCDGGIIVFIDKANGELTFDTATPGSEFTHRFQCPAEPFMEPLRQCIEDLYDNKIIS
jgi:hypothetical protein